MRYLILFLISFFIVSCQPIYVTKIQKVYRFPALFEKQILLYSYSPYEEDLINNSAIDVKNQKNSYYNQISLLRRILYYETEVCKVMKEKLSEDEYDQTRCNEIYKQYLAIQNINK